MFGFGNIKKVSTTNLLNGKGGFNKLMTKLELHRRHRNGLLSPNQAQKYRNIYMAKRNNNAATKRRVNKIVLRRQPLGILNMTKFKN
jgi:hypothetical protein